jgi:hypothetical protein
MDAVLPLRLSGGYQDQDLGRARILLHSLEHFWADAVRLRLIVIAPAAEVPAIHAGLRPCRLPLAVLREEVLLPELTDVPEVRGWFRQMALKLDAHMLVPSDFFLTLDADLICTQPLSRDRLFHQGRALTDWEPRGHHRAWWEGSAAALGLPERPEEAAGETPGLSVTPELLSTRILRALERALHPGGGAEAWTTLLRRPGLWSEYSLYTLFAEQAGMLRQHHLEAGWMRAHNRSLRAEGNVWFAAQLADWTPARAFAPGARGFFAVCQSSTGADPRAVWRQVAPFIPGSPF